MGVRHYSRDPSKRAWQERFDELQAMCHVAFYSPTIGELLDHGIARAHWRCRSRGECFHTSEPFALSRYGRKLKISGSALALRVQRLRAAADLNRGLAP